MAKRSYIKFESVLRNGLAPEYIAELVTIASKGYTLRNVDYDVLRYTTVR